MSEMCLLAANGGVMADAAALRIYQGGQTRNQGDKFAI